MQNSKMHKLKNYNSLQIEIPVHKGRTRVINKYSDLCILPDNWINITNKNKNNKRNRQRGEREYYLKSTLCNLPDN